LRVRRLRDVVFASAVTRCEDELDDKVRPLTALWRDKELQYTGLRTLQNRHAALLRDSRSVNDDASRPQLEGDVMSKRRIGVAACAGAPMAADRPAPQIAVYSSPHPRHLPDPDSLSFHPED
jgi:hypothetical protein